MDIGRDNHVVDEHGIDRNAHHDEEALERQCEQAFEVVRADAAPFAVAHRRYGDGRDAHGAINLNHTAIEDDRDEDGHNLEAQADQQRLYGPVSYTHLFENWCDFLNYFDSSIFVQFSFINQRTSSNEFKKQINIPEYSLRMSLNSSACSGMLICFLNSLMLVLWLMKENWTKIGAIGFRHPISEVYAAPKPEIREMIRHRYRSNVGNQ